MEFTELELLQSVKKGNRKAATMIYELKRIEDIEDKVDDGEIKSDYLVDLGDLEDEILIALHNYTEWLAPSYFIRMKYANKLKEADKNVLTLLVQSESKKAREVYLERYKSDFKNAPDEALVILAQEGNNDAFEYLVEKYLPFVKKIVQKLERKYFFRGQDTADLIQEGTMGLFKSTNDFKVERKTKFKDFSKHVIEKHMGTLIIRSANYKNRVLNESFSYHSPIGNDSEITFEQMLKSDTYHPERACISRETYKEIKEKLTKLERKVLKLYTLGLTYEEIGEKVGKKKKAVDNTIQRIRKKGKPYKLEI